MQLPLEITFRNVPKTDAVEALIKEKTLALERICDHITSCRVTVEQPAQHLSSGNPFQVRIELTVPRGHRVVVKREAGEGEMHENLGALLRKAFDAASRSLSRVVERQRGEVKAHEQPTI